MICAATKLEVATFNGLEGDAFARNANCGRWTDFGSMIKQYRCLVHINTNTQCKPELKKTTISTIAGPVSHLSSDIIDIT